MKNDIFKKMESQRETIRQYIPIDTEEVTGYTQREDWELIAASFMFAVMMVAAILTDLS